MGGIIRGKRIVPEDLLDFETMDGEQVPKILKRELSDFFGVLRRAGSPWFFDPYFLVEMRFIVPTCHCKSDPVHDRLGIRDEMIFCVASVQIVQHKNAFRP